MSLLAKDVSVHVGSKTLVDRASLACLPGQVVALLGPNGAGKSTLLSALTGERLAKAPATVTLNARALGAWRPAELARQRAVMRQYTQVPFAFSALEVVEFGHLPWQGSAANRAPLGPGRFGLTRPDARDYLEAVGLGGMGARKYPTLSGGEARRVQLARALIQVRALRELPAPPNVADPEVPARYLLLDEPLAGLDIAEASRVLGLIAQVSARNIGVIAVFHDLNAAAHIADHIVLMRRAEIIAQGTPAACMSQQNLEDCFRTPMSVTLSERGIPRIQPDFCAR
ncbi:heme ABC transporter ATP-binding protein [Bradymonas sediminis]|uniref:Uncharacterized protein n=1 Tax=Bradymonas sediminis TaxID=1548548 RepID=A0A2Z4FPU5_9DELT|nr:ATP-binding cassette domain-containing protein [Bradymonas sediminis]AWV91081.1 hypothetical protein DN745_17785 [Bradymonas sediminis]TDP75177.1 iron complex transport system ATP-binding protein [Bradymonas sediminis]